MIWYFSGTRLRHSRTQHNLWRLAPIIYLPALLTIGHGAHTLSLGFYFVRTFIYFYFIFSFFFVFCFLFTNLASCLRSCCTFAYVYVGVAYSPAIFDYFRQIFWTFIFIVVVFCFCYSLFTLSMSGGWRWASAAFVVVLATKMGRTFLTRRKFWFRLLGSDQFIRTTRQFIAFSWAYWLSYYNGIYTHAHTFSTWE